MKSLFGVYRDDGKVYLKQSMLNEKRRETLFCDVEEKGFKFSFCALFFPLSLSPLGNQNTEKKLLFFIEFSFLVFFPHRLIFCQKLANRLLSLLFMKLYFIDFHLFASHLPAPSYLFRLFSL